MLGGKHPVLYAAATWAALMQGVICDKKIALDACLDMANKNPTNIRYGYPFFELASGNRHCRGQNIAIDHECNHAMNPGNDCTAFCKQASGWFYGEPIDVQKDRMCHPGDPCERTESYRNTLSSTTTRITERRHGVDVSNQTKHTQHEQVGSTYGWNFNLQYDLNLGDVISAWTEGYTNAVKPIIDATIGKNGIAGAIAEVVVNTNKQLKKAPTWPNNGGPEYQPQDTSPLKPKKKSVGQRFKEWITGNKGDDDKKKDKNKKDGKNKDTKNKKEEKKSTSQSKMKAEKRSVLTPHPVDEGHSLGKRMNLPLVFGALGATSALLSGLQFGVGVEKSRSKKVVWDRIKEYSETATDSKAYALRNSTTYQVTIQRTEGLSRPDYSKYYCGSWYAVPMIGMDCGRLSTGELWINQASRESHCIVHDESQSGHCFDYTFASEKEGREGESLHEMQFVLKDCDKGFILPGEWQPPAFRHSFGVAQYVGHHVARYGTHKFQKRDSDRDVPEDDAWIQERFDYGDNKFTKTIGPTDYTIEVCGRGGYCARHRLTNGRCYTFPRGYVGPRTAHIVSARTSEDNCCVMFSKPECYGLPQMIRGNIRDLDAVGYEGLTSSVVCNVPEYCDYNRVEALSPAMSYTSTKKFTRPESVGAEDYQ
ncbi:hypothetical protein OQA88_1314 [Cercophora sp. LCS_1]